MEMPDTLLTDEDIDKLEEEIDSGLKGRNAVLNRLIELQDAKTKREFFNWLERENFADKALLISIEAKQALHKWALGEE